jgi:predicted XRE-type DNA-binding protein
MDRFWSKVLKGDGCWLWTGSMRTRGYGGFWLDGRNDMAHRVAWILAHGPIPEGLVVMHKCDNQSCVNPSHLQLGTFKDNSTDMVAKRRGREQFRAGDEHRNAKLTQRSVIEIRSLHESGVSQARLADKFGVTQSCISRAVTGKRWACQEGA